MKKAMHAGKQVYDYCTIDTGYSDVTSLAYLTSKGETGGIPVGDDYGYEVHLIAGNTEVPQQYKQFLDTDASWLWIYDDVEKTLDFLNPDGFEVYRAGEMGFLIRFK
nr:MAG TPA: hypothetical protein [Caudoviricetes sp.]